MKVPLKIFAIFFLAAAPAMIVCAGDTSIRPDADTEELIRRLGSDDFAEREAATNALAERAEKIWDRLEKLSKSHDLEISQRVKAAMARPAQRVFHKNLEASQIELTKAGEEMNEAGTKLKTDDAAADREIEKLDKDLEKLAEQRESDKQNKDAHQQAIAKLVEAKTAINDKRRAAHEAWEKKRTEFRSRHNRLQSRVAQLRDLTESGEIIRPALAQDYDPRNFPFERRLKLKVSFEFENLPLEQAISFVSEMSGIPIEIDAGVKQDGSDHTPISLRALDLSAEVSLGWLARLADLEFKITNDEPRKIRIVKDVGKK